MRQKITPMQKELLNNLSSDDLCQLCGFSRAGKFNINVPKWYIHETIIAEAKKRGVAFRKSLTDETFSGTTDKMEPGKSYVVWVYRLKNRSWKDRILSFMEEQPGIKFFGMQGLTLVALLARKKLPDWHTTYFDKGEKSVVSYVYRNIPLSPHDTEKWELGIFHPRYTPSSEDHILFFCECEKEE